MTNGRHQTEHGKKVRDCQRVVAQERLPPEVDSVVERSSKALWR